MTPMTKLQASPAAQACRGSWWRGRWADHFEPVSLELGEVRAHAVGQHQALVTPVVRLANDGVHAHLGCDAGDDQTADLSRPQSLLQVGGVEGALARLVDDDFAVGGGQLVDDVVAVLAPDQDPSPRAGISDAQ
jgi:hypothetical protein